MRKLTTCLALGALMASGAASAQSLARTSTSVLPPLSVMAQQARAPQRVSPNPEKLKGALLYAGQAFSWFNYPSWVRMGSDKPMLTMEPMFNFRDDRHTNIQRDRVQSAGGLYNPEDGYYYMVRCIVYDTYWAPGQMFCTVPEAWIRFRPEADTPENWDYLYDLKTNYSDVNGFANYYKDPTATPYNQFTDAFYDYRDKKFRAIVALPPEHEGELILSQWGEIDRETGIFEGEEVLTERYFGMTCDLDGTIYAIRPKYDFDGYTVGTVLVRLDRDNYFDEEILGSITDVGKPFKVAYQGTLEYDRNNNHLYFAGYNEDGYFKYFEFDDDFKQVNSEGTGLANHILKGLYAPYITADVRDAAGRVTSFASTPDASGANSVTLSWNNPKRQWNNKELTQLAEVLVYRDNLDTPIGKTTEVSVGGASTYTDATAAQGLHRYYLVPCRTEGEKGLRDSLNVFVGRDVADAPVGINAVSPDGKSVNLTWGEPTQGAHDGWYDKSAVTYNVRRLPDGVDVAQGVIEHSLTDTTLGDAMAYTYEVTAVTADGAGLPGQSNSVIAGNAWRAPKFFDFADDDVRYSFAAWDPQWGNSYDYENQDWSKCWKLNTGKGSDDILSSPKVKLEAGKSYRITWYVETWDHTNLYNINGGYCATNEPDARVFAGEDVEWYAPGNNKDNISFEFTAEETGEFHVFLEIKNGDEANDYDWIAVKSLNFEEVFPVDLRVIRIQGIKRFSSGQTQPVSVTVENNGISKVDAFTIQLLANGKNVLGETSDVKALAPGKQATYTFNVTAPANDPGQGVDVSAKVIAEGDGQADNDESDYHAYQMDPATTVPFNVSSFGKKYYEAGRDDTQKHVPVNMGAGASYCQTIYPAANLTLNPEADYKNVTRVAYCYNSTEEVNDSLTIYMAQTDRVDKYVKDGNGDCANPLDRGDFTVVASLNCTYRVGMNDLVIDLDSPFPYDPTKSLVVAVERTGAEYYSYPLSWALYDDAWSSKDGWSCRASKAWDGGFVHAAMPATFFAIDDGTIGIEQYSMDQQGWDAAPVYYNLMGQRISHPGTGIFIEVRGSKVRKVALK